MPNETPEGTQVITVDVGDVDATPDGPHAIRVSDGAICPVGAVHYLTMSPEFPEYSLGEKPKRPKRSWPGQGDDRAMSRRKTNRGGRRRR